MHMSGIPFGVTDWASVEPTSHAGEVGTATWRTRQFGEIRVRMVEYSPGYISDHWCEKGHILYCLEGNLETELADGRRFTLTPGTITVDIVDGEFEIHALTSGAADELEGGVMDRKASEMEGFVTKNGDAA